MSNINNLTSKILSDAEERKESILKEANEEKAKIVSKKEALAKSEEATMVEKAKTEAKTAKERIISGAELKSRNEKLTAKQAVIDKVFENSIEKLCKMSDEEIKEFIKNKIVNADIVGDETIILNEKGNKLVDVNLLKEINSELLAKGKKGELTINKEDGIEINNTFEDLVNSERDDLEFEVAKVLFN